MQLIGIAGHKRSGKDSVCNILAENYGYQKIAFADDLRLLCSLVFDIGSEFFIQDDLKEKSFKHPIQIKQKHLDAIKDYIYTLYKGTLDLTKERLDKKTQFWRHYLRYELETPREILMIVGTDLIRNHIDPSYHAKILFNKIKSNPNQKYCISDCRFKNEREMVKAHGGKLIYIYSANDDKSFKHISENSLGDPESYDVKIYNTKNGLDVLEVKVVYAVKALKGEIKDDKKIF